MKLKTSFDKDIEANITVIKIKNSIHCQINLGKPITMVEYNNRLSQFFLIMFSFI